MKQRHDNPPSAESRSKRAYSVMLEVRNTLYRRLVEHVLANEGRLKDEVSGEDSYSFTLQQVDEQFLNKLNIVERAVAELTRCEYREGQTTTTTYETIEVLAKREELPQKVADALADHGESDFLDMCVLRADDKQAEILLVLAREESGPPATAAPAEKKKHGKQGEQGEKGNDEL
ncbi:MAG: hypothetical protein NTW87_36605 [Planctomycetota bacterium]|nr:hypothetical protein [Planctomycetota bacterium]